MLAPPNIEDPVAAVGCRAPPPPPPKMEAPDAPVAVVALAPPPNIDAAELDAIVVDFPPKMLPAVFEAGADEPPKIEDVAEPWNRPPPPLAALLAPPPKRPCCCWLALKSAAAFTPAIFSLL